MRKQIIGVVLAASLLASGGCGMLQNITGIMAHPPSQTQIVKASADAVDAATQLGEVILQLQQASHKLAVGRVITPDQDIAVQNAAVAYANSMDKAVEAASHAASLGQIVAAMAPLVGAATSVTSTLASVQGVSGVKGALAVVAGQVPSLYQQARDLIKKLEGN